MSKTVKNLIIANVSVFLLSSIWQEFPIGLLAMVPRLVFSKLMIWQLVTYMFVHLDLWHLVMNMLMLWFFGPAIEAAWGQKRFLIYYFFTGIGAALCSVIFSFNSPIIGASGAIFGILVAYAMLYPDNMILFFFFVPMKMKHAVFVLAGINLLGAISASGSGIAYIAHLGGGLFGYLYLKNETLRHRLLSLDFEKIKSWFNKPSAKPTKSTKPNKPKTFDERVDEILDKISKKGMASLTKEEIDILDRRSRS
ncbi:MAG: rhomboid family intramembrane serine protease [Candidatus Omnitrophica bacterium]|nr:rhomboid family intramembrane serine protease [Candidatus Omnitrophota bacterium]